MSVTQDMKASRHRVAQTLEYKHLYQLSFCSKLQNIRTRFLCVLIRGGRIMTCWICDVGLPIFRQLGDRLSFIYVSGNVMFPIYFSLEVVKTTISVATRDGNCFWPHDVGIEHMGNLSWAQTCNTNYGHLRCTIRKERWIMPEKKLLTYLASTHCPLFTSVPGRRTWCHWKSVMYYHYHSILN